MPIRVEGVEATLGIDTSSLVAGLTAAASAWKKYDSDSTQSAQRATSIVSQALTSNLTLISSTALALGKRYSKVILEQEKLTKSFGGMSATLKQATISAKAFNNALSGLGSFVNANLAESIFGNVNIKGFNALGSAATKLSGELESLGKVGAIAVESVTNALTQHPDRVAAVLKSFAISAAQSREGLLGVASTALKARLAIKALRGDFERLNEVAKDSAGTLQVYANNPFLLALEKLPIFGRLVQATTTLRGGAIDTRDAALEALAVPGDRREDLGRQVRDEQEQVARGRARAARGEALRGFLSRLPFSETLFPVTDRERIATMSGGDLRDLTKEELKQRQQTLTRESEARRKEAEEAADTYRAWRDEIMRPEHRVVGDESMLPLAMRTVGGRTPSERQAFADREKARQKEDEEQKRKLLDFNKAWSDSLEKSRNEQIRYAKQFNQRLSAVYEKELQTRELAITQQAGGTTIAATDIAPAEFSTSLLLGGATRGQRAIPQTAQRSFGLAPGTAEGSPVAAGIKAQSDMLSELTRRQGEYRQKLRGWADSVTGTLVSNLNTSIATGNFKTVGEALVGTLRATLAFVSAKSLEKVFEPFVEGLIDGLTSALSKGAAGGAGGGFGKLLGSKLGGFLGGIGTFLGGFFHEGGVVPGSNRQERLAVVRGGEAIFTPSQIRALQQGREGSPFEEGSGTSGRPIQLVFNGTADQKTMLAFNRALPRMARALDAEERRQYLRRA